MTYVGLTKEKSGKLSQKSSDQDFTRSALIAELDAVNLYQSQIENTNDKELKDILGHIMDEEKGHVAELSCKLLKQDPTQEKSFRDLLKTSNIKSNCLFKH